jgi:hypothetical protein
MLSAIHRSAFTESPKRWSDTVASSIGARVDVEHSISRFVLTVGFFFFHHAVFALTRRLLLGQHEPYLTVPLLLASLVNGVVALGLFPLLDRLRKS